MARRGHNISFISFQAKNLIDFIIEKYYRQTFNRLPVSL